MADMSGEMPAKPGTAVCEKRTHTVVHVDESGAGGGPGGGGGGGGEGDAWHYEESVDGVLFKLGVDMARGLSSEEAAVRLRKYGRNELTEHDLSPWWVDLLSHFTDHFSLLLLLAASLSLLAFLYDRADASHLYLGLFLFAVVLVTSCFTFAQQRTSHRTLQEFRTLLPHTARVARDARPPTSTPAAALVPGDVVAIAAGDRIPADVRVVRCHDAFAVDNATLTGEATPVSLYSRAAASSSSSSSSPSSSLSLSSSKSPCMDKGMERGSRRGALEAGNMAFFGCFAVEGSCTAVVVATGDRTMFGKIAALTTTVDHSTAIARTTLQRDVQHFVRTISTFAALVGATFFLAGVYLRVRLAQNVVYTLGIIVSNIPEGLLATVTASLTASAKRMARKHVLVKRLDAVETLGSTTVVVTDKTGTLTAARMAVAHVAFAGTVANIGTDWTPPAADQPAEVRTAFAALLHGASVCSTAVFSTAAVDDEDDDNSTTAAATASGTDPDTADEVDPEARSSCSKTSFSSSDTKSIHGDASEAAVLRFSQKLHDTIEYRAAMQVTTKIPFNSRDKIMVTVDSSLANVNDDVPLVRVVMKGAPERVLSHCDSRMCAEGVRELSFDGQQLIERQVEYFAQRGERVLAYAEKYVPRSRIEKAEGADEDDEDDGDDERGFSADEFLQRVGSFCFVGLLSLTDPPREGVADAVCQLRLAGIRVMMVTGDHVKTAVSVAESTGVVTNSVTHLPMDGRPRANDSAKALLVHGSAIQTLDDKAWDNVLSRNEVVFARATPEDKVTIVRRLREAGHIVTATGDGCNDAPALRAANAGVAMGTTGSDVSRAAADVVLLDDNFCNLVHGVSEGRLIFDNLRKSIAYTLASNVPQLVPFLLFVVLRLPLPLTATLVLCIDLGTDVFPAIALAYEPHEHNILNRPPRKRDDHLLDNRLIRFSSLQIGLLQTFAGFLAYVIVFNDAGFKPFALPGLARRGYFGALRRQRQRWLLAENDRQGLRRASFKGVWFSRTETMFSRYFSNQVNGFSRQSYENFNRVPTGSAQFANMIKIVGAELRRPPCIAFTCDEGRRRNDNTCFDPTSNAGPVLLDFGKRNHAVTPGTGDWEGCFDLWTPKRQRTAMRMAQTAFFVAVVISQVFTIFACRTRFISVLPQLFSNAAVWLAIKIEFSIAFSILYIAPVANALRTVPLYWVYWLPALPFGAFILASDEVRKWLIRRHLSNTSGITVPSTKFVDRLAKWVYNFSYW